MGIRAVKAIIREHDRKAKHKSDLAILKPMIFEIEAFICDKYESDLIPDDDTGYSQEYYDIRNILRTLHGAAKENSALTPKIIRLVSKAPYRYLMDEALNSILPKEDRHAQHIENKFHEILKQYHNEHIKKS